MNNKFLIRLLFILLILITLITIPPSIAGLLSLATQHKDIMLNYEKYLKKSIIIDSLEFHDLDGSDYEDVSGYSKYLNNYKTEIILGSVRDDNVSEDLGMNDDGNLKKQVWFRNGINYAYLAKEKDNQFPINVFICEKIKVPILCIISLIISILIYKKFNFQKVN